MKRSGDFSYSSCGPITNEDQARQPLRVVITGGCGFLGRHIAKSLYNEFKDVRITLMDIVPADTALMTFITEGVPLGQPVSFSVVDKDVTRLPHLLRIFRQTDIVFHCASSSSSATKTSLVIVDGTRNVIRACKECGVRVLVYSGSLLQNIRAAVTTQHGINENEWENTQGKLLLPRLAGLKNEAERMVLDACDTKLYTCSIRCPPLYGEFDNAFIPSAISLANLLFGMYPNFGDPRIRMTAMYAGNAAWAHVCAAKKLLHDRETSSKSDVSGKFLYVGDYTPTESYTCFFMRFLRPLGYTSTVPVPLSLLELLLFVSVLLVSFLSYIFNLQPFYFLFDYQNRAKLFSISHTLVWRKSQLLIDYKPKFSFHKAIKLSIDNWYRLWT